MRVRAAVPGDAEAIAAVHVAAWQEAYAHVFPAEVLAALDPVPRARHWREGIRGGWTVLVSDDLSGFVSIGPARDADEPELGELYAIYVTPERWGSGAGRALMAAALDALRGAGFSEAVLWVLEDNPRARRFYERAGWVTDGAVKEDEFLGTRVGEVRYRVSLR
jgi:GNAT superfamily N-acetyltransferase